MNNFGTDLNENDLAKLEAAWIPAELARLAMLRRVSSLDGAQMMGRKHGDNCAGIIFPYVWPGESSGRADRLRRDTPDVKMEGADRKETGKYLSPVGTPNMLYFFPGTPAAWLSDAELPVVITEGEKKTLALWRLAWHELSDGSEQARYLPIGLSGVWNWRGTIGKESGPNGERVAVKGVIPDFGRIEWKERKVVLLFDANVKSNESVRAARTELARHLIHECGAHVYYADLPPREGVNGVDDLLAAVGPAKVLQILNKAKEARVKEKRTPAELLSRLYEGTEFFHAADQTLYATVQVDDHKETWPLKSPTFRSWLTRRFYADQGKPPTKQSLDEAIYMCDSMARFDGPEHETSLRIAKVQGNLYLDLCDPKWRTVEISPTGWRVTQDAPVRFRRQPGMLALPHPLSGGTIEELRPFLNAEDEENWILMVAWLIGALHPAGPYPLLVLQGERGSRKSSTARFLRSLVDPSSVPIRAEPREERDLMISAHNGWVIAMDNLSGTKHWISDALCRLSTGGGFSVRRLHSDDQEMLFQAKRPMILNGIDDMTTQPDLLDRSLVLSLSQMKAKYIQEEVLRPAFEEAMPRVLGALLDAVSIGLRRQHQVQIPDMPRMADFASWVVACSPGLPFTAAKFLKTYGTNRIEALDTTIESSPVAKAVLGLVTSTPEWQGTSTELLSALEKHVPDRRRALASWPKEERYLGNILRRIVPVLRQAGVEIEFVRQGKFRTRMIFITTTPEQTEMLVRHVRLFVTP